MQSHKEVRNLTRWNDGHDEAVVFLRAEGATATFEWRYAPGARDAPSFHRVKIFSSCRKQKRPLHRTIDEGEAEQLGVLGVSTSCGGRRYDAARGQPLSFAIPRQGVVHAGAGCGEGGFFAEDAEGADEGEEAVAVHGGEQGAGEFGGFLAARGG